MQKPAYSLLSLSFREVTAATSRPAASTAVQSAEAERSRVMYVVSQCRLSACVRPLALRMFDFQY